MHCSILNERSIAISPETITNSRMLKISITVTALHFSTKIIIQAIGRICRTNQKRKNIYVFADNRIAENIDFSILNRSIVEQRIRRFIR